MRCNVCGADNLEGSVYCEDCGARLPAATAAAPAPPPVAHDPAPIPPMPSPPTPPPSNEGFPTADPGAVAVSAPPAAPAASGGGGGASVNCSACGAVNPPGVAFCEDCGASLGEGAPAPVSGDFTPPVNYDSPNPVATPSAPVSAGGSSRLVLSNGKEFPLSKDTILLGRRSPVDGIFPEVDLTDHDVDSYISRRHGRITRGEQGLVYEDLGSSNGSFLNGSRLQANIQQQLKDGDSLRLGKTEMVFRAH